MGMFPYVREFLVAVINHWVYFYSGCALIAFASLWQGLKQRTMPRRAVILIASLCLMGALYMAWEDEYQKTRPGLRVAILNVGISPSPIGATRVLMTASVSNLGPPSIADEWILRIKKPAGSELISRPSLFAPDKPIVSVNPNNDGRTYTYGAADALYLKTSQAPIATGSKIVGLLTFELESLKYDDADRVGTIFVLQCADVSGNRIAGEYAWKGVPTPIQFFPGMRPPDIK